MNIKKVSVFVFIGAAIFKILLILIFQYAPLTGMGLFIVGSITVDYDPISIYLADMLLGDIGDIGYASPLVDVYYLVATYIVNVYNLIVVIAFAVQCLLLTFLIYGIVRLFKRKLLFIVGELLFVFCGLGFSDTNVCRIKVKAEDNNILSGKDNPLGNAILFSDTVNISAFRLSFINEVSKDNIIPSRISIVYKWKWLEYPYPEHSWGVWSIAGDIVECRGGVNEIHVPEFEVIPRGWYDGKYTWFPYPKRPSFNGVSIVVTTEKCTTRAEISPKDARKLKGKSVEFNVNCNGTSSINILKNKVSG